MSPGTMRLIFSIAIFVHGIGHIQGVLSSLGLFNSDHWHPRSWLFDRLLGEKTSRILGLCLWALSFLGFIAAGFAFLGIALPHSLWRRLAILAAVPSSLGLIFYWHSLAMFFNKAGAVLVNAWALIGLLLLNWPGESDFGF